MTTEHTVPSRRTVLAGALGIGAFSGAALTAAPSSAALGDPAIPTSPEAPMYLTIDGIRSELEDEDYQGALELITWGWGVDNLNNGNGGNGVGKPVSQDVVLLTKMGSHSPILAFLVESGGRIPRATISLAKPAGGSTHTMEWLTLTFDQVVLTSYSLTPDSDGVPLDLFHMRVLSSVTHTYTPQLPDGRPGTKISATWDYSRNRGALTGVHYPYVPPT